MLHKLSLTHFNKHPAEFSLHKRGSIKGGAHKEADETETKDPGTKSGYGGVHPWTIKQYPEGYGSRCDAWDEPDCADLHCWMDHVGAGLMALMANGADRKQRTMEFANSE